MLYMSWVKQIRRKKGCRCNAYNKQTKGRVKGQLWFSNSSSNLTLHTHVRYLIFLHLREQCSILDQKHATFFNKIAESNTYIFPCHTQVVKSKKLKWFRFQRDNIEAPDYIYKIQLDFQKRRFFKSSLHIVQIRKNHSNRQLI